MWPSVGWRIWFSGLVDSNDAELIPLALAQARNASFQLLNGGGAVVIVGDECVEPTAEFVFLLNNVVTDGATAGVLGFGPAQGHGFVVKVHDFGLTGSGGWSWNTRCVKITPVVSYFIIAQGKNCLLYGFSARMGSVVKRGSDWPSLLMAETSNWYRWPGLRPLAVALQEVLCKARESQFKNLQLHFPADYSEVSATK